MTKKIRLSLGSETVSTVVSNIFIDKYMAEANGSYVKVYIYLLRCLNDPSMDVSVSDFSEKLDETEKDIIKALKYWEKKSLLSISLDSDGQISNLAITPLGGMVSPAHESEALQTERRRAVIAEDPITVDGSDVSDETGEPADPKRFTVSAPAKSMRETGDITSAPSYTPQQIEQLKERDDFEQLIDYVESKFGSVLNHTKLNTLAFTYELFNMNCELIRYLYDYCFYKGKTGSKYIESVAIAWEGKEIDTVEKAMQETFMRSKECSVVRNSFGLQRLLGGVELEYIRRWSYDYGMNSDMIKEACDRTLIQTSKTDFKYADRILKDWSSKGAKALSDITQLDADHQKNKSAQMTFKAAPKAASGKFAQFTQRDYSSDEYSELEKKKLGTVS
ncbi:MAG: DnaD domain protein [Lachnospiraceae bacterium]|nr:DnaD domain protein [Lachnospiraceae bacterium]